MHPTFYRGCWHVVSRYLFPGYSPCSSPRKALYDPKAFIAHAALLGQAFAHCPIFLTAASRRSLARVSVPVWGVTLSGPLPVAALVGHYPTNKLMGRRPLPKRLSALVSRPHAVLAVLSDRYSPLRGRYLRVTHPSATEVLPKEPLRSTCMC